MQEHTLTTVFGNPKLPKFWSRGGAQKPSFPFQSGCSCKIVSCKGYYYYYLLLLLLLLLVSYYYCYYYYHLYYYYYYCYYYCSPLGGTELASSPGGARTSRGHVCGWNTAPGFATLHPAKHCTFFIDGAGNAFLKIGAKQYTVAQS